MLKKSLGGLSLFVFVFMFTAYPLIVVKTADAGHNVVYDRTHTVYYVCANGGGEAYSVTYENRIEESYNHPPTTPVLTWKVEPGTGFRYQVWVDEHTSHNVTYNDLTTSETRTAWNHWKCR